MPDSPQIAGIAHRVRFSKGGEYAVESIPMGPNRLGTDGFVEPVARFAYAMHPSAGWFADLLHDSCRQDGCPGEFQELILDRGTAQVEYEDFHRPEVCHRARAFATGNETGVPRRNACLGNVAVRCYSLLVILTVALDGAPMVYAALGDNVTVTVSTGSGVWSSRGLMVMNAVVLPAGILKEPVRAL